MAETVLVVGSKPRDEQSLVWSLLKSGYHEHLRFGWHLATSLTLTIRISCWVADRARHAAVKPKTGACQKVAILVD